MANSLIPTSVAEADRRALRTAFGEEAELYDLRRPRYPDALFEDLANSAGLLENSRVLELGCGTGQATLPLARRGLSIVALDIHEAMVAVARRSLKSFPKVDVVNSPFELWPLPARPFDIVFSATAFHWIDPGIRVSKSAEALRPGGVLAVASTYHIAGGTEDFFTEAQLCYERFLPNIPRGMRLPQEGEIAEDVSTFDASGKFDPSRLYQYAWDETYTACEYVELLRTYAGHRTMPDGPREGLLNAIEGLIEGSYGGAITKRYLVQLSSARRR
ncbi:class I SAM-dependent methyltransferase [Streptomyces exfoliatus]|uniref:class I SAM-dependent methyltransferase n=1 Tax=Streptomyces exfoliatus TaxID=1905 RepID=UPI003C2E67B8